LSEEQRSPGDAPPVECRQTFTTGC